MNSIDEDIARESVYEGKIAPSSRLDCVVPHPHKTCLAAPTSAEPPKFTWLSCGGFHCAGIPVVPTNLKLAAFVPEEGAWQKTLSRSASNARLFFSVLPTETLASKS